MTSPLVPWNSCGAYMTGVLGVSTLQYAPWALFNYLNPLVAIVLRAHRLPRRAPRAGRRGVARRRPSRPAARNRRPPEDEESRHGHRRDRPRSRAPPSRRPPPPEEPKRRFQLPSAYTILFALIVITALATWIIPAGRYALDDEGSPIPGTYEEVDVEPGADPRRLAEGADQRPLRHRGPGHRRTSTSTTRARLFGAIDVALFILVIGGFIGITMKTGAIQAGIARLVREAARPRALDDPDPHDGLRHRRHDVRHGRGEPRVLRAHHHGDDRRRLRRARPARR